MQCTRREQSFRTGMPPESGCRRTFGRGLRQTAYVRRRHDVTEASVYGRSTMQLRLKLSPASNAGWAKQNPTTMRELPAM